MYRKRSLSSFARLSVLLALASGIAACREPNSPDAGIPDLRPNFDAMISTALPSPAECTGNLLPSEDRDNDGFKDSCEYQLADAARPVLEIGLGEIDASRQPYWAALYTNSGGIQRVHIAYLFSYNRDWGEGSFDSGHDGDSEFMFSDYQWDPRRAGGCL